jgi:hypothetical protein
LDAATQHRRDRSFAQRVALRLWPPSDTENNSRRIARKLKRSLAGQQGEQEYRGYKSKPAQKAINAKRLEVFQGIVGPSDLMEFLECERRDGKEA